MRAHPPWIHNAEHLNLRQTVTDVGPYIRKFRVKYFRGTTWEQPRDLGGGGGLCQHVCVRVCQCHVRRYACARMHMCACMCCMHVMMCMWCMYAHVCMTLITQRTRTHTVRTRMPAHVHACTLHACTPWVSRRRFQNPFTIGPSQSTDMWLHRPICSSSACDMRLYRPSTAHVRKLTLCVFLNDGVSVRLVRPYVCAYTHVA